MPTYGNTRTGVVHFIPQVTMQAAWATRTACHFLDQFRQGWDWGNLDAAGVPADVTCRKCRETDSFLDAAEDPTPDNRTPERTT